MNVRGIARDEATPEAVACCQPLVDAEDRQPARLPEAETMRAIAVDAMLDLVERCRFVAFGRVGAAHGEDAPDFLAEGKHRDGAAVVPPQIDTAMVEIAAVDLHVGQQEGLRLGVAFEGDLHQLSHGAARAVAARKIFGRYGFAAAIGVAQGGGDARRILRDTNQLDVALDGDAKLAQPRSQELFGAGLRQQQRKRKSTVDALTHRQGGKPSIAFADAQRMESLPFPHEAVDDAHALQGLEACAPQSQRFGDRACLRVAVDDAHTNAKAAQGDGQRQAGRTGAHDENFSTIFPTHRLLLCEPCLDGASARPDASRFNAWARASIAQEATCSASFGSKPQVSISQRQTVGVQNAAMARAPRRRCSALRCGSDSPTAAIQAPWRSPLSATRWRSQEGRFIRLRSKAPWVS